MKSFALLVLTFTLVLLLFYELYSPYCPEPTVITVAPEIRYVYVTRAPEPPRPVPEMPEPREIAENPHQVIAEDWPKPELHLPPKPFSGEIPESHKANEPLAPHVIDAKNKEALPQPPGQPEVIVDNNVPDIGDVDNPEPLPPAEMRALQPAKTKLPEIPEYLQLFSNCLYISLFRVPDKEVFSYFEKAYAYCMSTLHIADEAISRYIGLDDFRYFITPLGLSETLKCNVITLGINQNIKIELQWQKKFEFCNFIGSDPNAVNAELFRTVGKFVPYPVESKNKTKETKANLNTFNMASFLQANALSPVDQISINIKGLEYSNWDNFFKNGPLDQVDYAVCQWNIEYHEPNEMQREQFGVFMRKVVKDGRYLPLKYSNLGNTKMFYLNVEDPICVQRYLSGRF